MTQRLHLCSNPKDQVITEIQSSWESASAKSCLEVGGFQAPKRRREELTIDKDPIDTIML